MGLIDFSIIFFTIKVNSKIVFAYLILYLYYIRWRYIYIYIFIYNSTLVKAIAFFPNITGPTLFLVRDLEGDVIAACIDSEWKMDQEAPFGDQDSHLFMMLPRVTQYRSGALVL